ncbi:MAG TPA: sulfurtransferase [Vicinamibacterales bacterium]|nr:sulfurtransferase [Vicinamibacterales bacterium]
MAFRTLITSGALALHLSDSAFRIIDCRFKLDDVHWGEREYETAHIPGASYAHLDRDLSGAKTGTNGRHPLPDANTLAAAFGRLGITSGVQVVAYDQNNGMFASRLWWLLRWLGHDAVAVLDGGFAKWTAEGRETRDGREQANPSEFTGSPRTGMTIDADGVASLVHKAGWRLIDARAPERYRGETEPLDKLPGHIPGAANHFFQTNVDAGGVFLTPEELRTRHGASLGGVSPDHSVAYCGSGVTACHNLLAMEHAGLTGARLYPGSWSEWSADPKRPVERS